MTRIVGVLIGLALLGQGGLAGAQEAAVSPKESTASDIAYGVASGAGTVVYTPLKLLLCIAGIGAGSLQYVLDGPTPAKTLWKAACTGTRALTPGILKGTEPLRVVNDVVKGESGR